MRRQGPVSVREAFIPCLLAAVIALFCRQYDIIKDNDSNNNKEKTKPSSEHSTPERPSGGLLRSKVREGLAGGMAYGVCCGLLPERVLALSRDTPAHALTLKTEGV